MDTTDDMRAMSYAAMGGAIRFWVSEGEEAAPALVFLPGLTADHRLFEPQLSYFLGKRRCLVWDPPAHGASRPFSRDFTMDDLARMLADVLAVAGIVRPVLVGQSMGGYVSQAFLDLFPGAAVAFVSIDSAPLKRIYYPTWEVKALRHTRGMYRAMPFGLLKAWGAWGVSATDGGRRQMRSFVDGYERDEYVGLASFGYRLLADAVEADRAYDPGCPTLLLCGERDRAGDVRAFNRRWARGEGLPLVWVPGAGHNANVDNPAFVNARIEEFVRSLPHDG